MDHSKLGRGLVWELSESPFFDSYHGQLGVPREQLWEHKNRVPFLRILHLTSKSFVYQGVGVEAVDLLSQQNISRIIAECLKRFASIYEFIKLRECKIVSKRIHHLAQNVFTCNKLSH